MPLNLMQMQTQSQKQAQSQKQKQPIVQPPLNRIFLPATNNNRYGRMNLTYNNVNTTQNSSCSSCGNK
jgi:hypothetical protein